MFWNRSPEWKILRPLTARSLCGWQLMPIALFIHHNQSVKFTDELEAQKGWVSSGNQGLPQGREPGEMVSSPTSAVSWVTSAKSSSQDLLRPVDLTALTPLVKPHPWKTNFPSRNHTSMGARLPPSLRAGQNMAWGPEATAGRQEGGHWHAVSRLMQSWSSGRGSWRDGRGGESSGIQ